MNEIKHNPKDLAIVILAAGKGKRMNNPDLPKVLAEIEGTPLLKYVLDTAQKLKPSKIIIIVGNHKEKVIEYVGSLNLPNVYFAVQAEQLGTGHAVAQAKEALGDHDCDVLILSGDVPLLRAETLEELVNYHRDNNSDLTALTTIAENPAGYGRIFRDEEGSFVKIIEERDAAPEEKKITEVNGGVYAIDSNKLFAALESVKNNNAQGEYYLTDVVQILRNKGEKTFAINIAAFNELIGINSQEELKLAADIYKEEYH
ncbi:MAG: sugar phosphate nucleotidyltransferase [Chloroflexota bacterium]